MNKLTCLSEFLHFFIINPFYLNGRVKYSNILPQGFFYFYELHAIKIEIKTKKVFEYVTACTMNLEYMKVSYFELYYRRK